MSFNREGDDQKIYFLNIFSLEPGIGAQKLKNEVAHIVCPDAISSFT